MKILHTLGFIIVSIAYFYSLILLQILIKSRLFEKKKRLFKSFLIRVALLILIFMQFWLLTFDVFPFLILILLIAASILTLLLSTVVSAILGVSMEEIAQKIDILWLAERFKQKLEYPKITLLEFFTGTLLLISWITALIIFWLNPLGASDIYVWIAILIFIVPTFIGIEYKIVLDIPILTSQYIDNDLRNQYIAESFSNLLYSTIYFIFPYFILKEEFSDKFTWLPPYWFIISIPLILFFLLTVIPYFIGTSKFKNRSIYFLEWRKNWAHNFKKIFTIPDEEKKITSKEKLVKVLEEEIDHYSTENKLYDFLKNKTSLKKEHFIRKSFGMFYADDLPFLIYNKDSIRKWNIQIEFSESLKTLKDNIASGKITELKEFISEELNNAEIELKQFNEKKNSIPGVVYSLLAGIITYLFKTYQDDLIKLLNSLIPS